MRLRRSASCRSGGTVSSSSSKRPRPPAGRLSARWKSHVGRRGGSQSAACGHVNATLWEHSWARLALARLW
jgi:hypothetical protein